MSWWSQNWVGAIGIAIGVIGILAAFWQRRPKRLDYKIITNVPVVPRAADNIRHDLAVTYGGAVVKDLHVVRIRVINSGKQAIRAGDYDVPVTITYEKDVPLDAFISHASTPELCHTAVQFHDDGPDLDPSKISIAPGLLNPGEWVDVQLISDGPPGEIEVRSRFADQSRAMRDVESRWGKRYLMLAIATLAVYLPIGIFIAFSRGEVLGAIVIILLGLLIAWFNLPQPKPRIFRLFGRAQRHTKAKRSEL
jgi:hypothetical protein